MPVSSSEHKSVLISGCSAGSIGDAVAKQFKARGWETFATARNLDKVKHLEQLGIHTIELDVTDEDSIRRAKAVVEQKTNGRLDVLFNNAGQNLLRTFSETSLSEARALFEVNLFSIISMSQAFLPLLMRAKGTILNHGSISGCTAVFGQSVYSSSKAAAAALSNAMRIEFAPFDVRVVFLVTGMVKSNIFPSDPPDTIAHDSLYTQWKEGIEDQWAGKYSLQHMTPTEDYAKKLVTDLLGENWWTRNAQWLWEGSASGMVWFLTNFSWQGALDSLTLKMFGIKGKSKDI